jgi:hypothetical protein
MKNTLTAGGTGVNEGSAVAEGGEEEGVAGSGEGGTRVQAEITINNENMRKKNSQLTRGFRIVNSWCQLQVFQGAFIDFQ